MAQASGSEEVRFTTTMGDFSVELYPTYAPRTCKNFAELCALPCPRPRMHAAVALMRTVPLAERGAATTTAPSSTA